MMKYKSKCDRSYSTTCYYALCLPYARLWFFVWKSEAIIVEIYLFIFILKFGNKINI